MVVVVGRSHCITSELEADPLISHLKERGVGMSYIDRRGKASQRVRTGIHLVCAGNNKEASLLNHSD